MDFLESKVARESAVSSVLRVTKVCPDLLDFKEKRVTKASLDLTV